MWYIGGYVMRANPASNNAEGAVSQDAWGYLAMVCVYLYGFIYCATWQGITWVYCSEIFPLDIRMLCVAITTADQWLWSFIISRTTPYMITSLGYGTYMLFGSLMIVMGCWAFFFIPETKGRLPIVLWKEVHSADLLLPGLTLEDMDHLFMHSMHRTVWNQITRRGHPDEQIKTVEVGQLPANSFENDKRSSEAP